MSVTHAAYNPACYTSKTLPGKGNAMKKHLARIVSAVTLLSVTAVLAYAGGWSIITLREFPDSAIEGRPLNLTFTVRQHGVTLLTGLQPVVHAGAGSTDLKAAAKATKNPGEYSASIVLPSAGTWTVRIDGGFNPEDKTRVYNSVTMPPLVVNRADTPGTPMSHETRGSRLFVSKGCVGCHAAGSDNDVTKKKLAGDYLRRFLADPSIRTVDMPNLALSDNEIGALVAFLTPSN